MKRVILYILLFIFILAPTAAEAKRKPTAKEQREFTEKYNEMKDKGGDSFKKWQDSVNRQGAGDKGDIETQMLVNLEKGLKANGKEKSAKEIAQEQAEAEAKEKAKGFMGDPNDPGPQDWSDYIIETDADGNVTGFKDEDHYQKDLDGDGQVTEQEMLDYEKNRADEFMDKDGDGTASDQEKKDAAKEMDTNKDGKVDEGELEAWNDQKAKEKEEQANGGPPGNNRKPPEWDDEPPDGKPDVGFSLDCYQCKKSFVDPGCQDGTPGPCPGTCSTGEECHEHTEGPRTCHACVPKEDQVPFCEACGYNSDASCGGKCPSIACAPLDIDLDSCKIIPSLQTRVRGSTQQCFGCINIKEIVIEYWIIIVETPYGRYVLENKGKKDGFKPTSVMALSKVDQATGMVNNVTGELKAITDFMGGFNVGLSPMGITTTGKLSMDSLSNMLGSKLSGGGSFGADCFGDVVNEADKQAESQGTPTSKDIEGTGKSRKSDKKKGESENFSEEQIKTAEEAGMPAVSGPIVACGNEGREKVLRIYDSAGALVDTITQAMFKLDPSIITKKLGFAQQAADFLIQKSGFDFAGYVEKFTGLPIKQAQAYAAKVASIKAKADQIAGIAANAKKKQKKAKVKEEEKIVIPNDPLFLSQEKPKSAVAERMKKVAANPFSSGIRMIGGELGGGGEDAYEEIQKKKAEQVKDQWGIRKVGYTDESDPNSAWNVVDANVKNVVVAIVDSGLDMSHPDAPQYIWTNPKETPGNGIDDDQNGFVDDINGWNFLDENHDFTDIRGHGTFVAGIIAAKSDNGIGIAGINPGAVIMPIKVADEEGVTNSLNIYRGINYAVNHGAKIINVSLGSRSISKLEQQAIERAQAMGALVFIAAGNNNDNIMEFGPASSKYGISVGQIDMSGVRSTVSNWGANLALVAPGEQILSLCSKDNKHVLPSVRKEGYYRQDGTSFAAPMVAATASLLLAKYPNLTNQQIADIILATTTDMDEPGWDGMTGYGLLNASAALRSSVEQQLIMMFTTLRLNKDINNKVISVDVHGTVRGPFREFTVEAGKGKNPGKFERVAGPFIKEANYQYLTRINIQNALRGSQDWVLRIKAIDQNGKEHFASTPFALPK